MHSLKTYLEEANKVVTRISTEEGISAHGSEGAVFIDVRDSSAIAASGTIVGAVRIPRGFIPAALVCDSKGIPESALF